jgi:hypothetical protein
MPFKALKVDGLPDQIIAVDEDMHD